MQVRLAFGKTGLTVELPDSAEVIAPQHLPAVPDASAALRAALLAPIESRPLPELARATDTVGIVFSDITRPVPSHLLIAAIREALAHVPDGQFALFNATGTHRANTDAELRQMLGDEVVARYRIHQHDAHDDAAHVTVGTTRDGNPIRIDRAFTACDVRILTGLIEPHFFAGFSGGGKAVMPGLAAMATVQWNHRGKLMDHPQARWGITVGNPLWEEMRDAARMTNPTFLLNVSVNREQEITGIFAGDPEAAHAAGCAFVAEQAMARVESPFDIVISTNSGYPLDLNLYQTVKGMSAAAQIVKPGGAIIVASECCDGLPHGSPYACLLQNAPDLGSLLADSRALGPAEIEMWQAHIQALICQQAEVYVYSPHLTDDDLRSVHLRPCHSIETTVDGLLARYGADARIAVLSEGPQTVPYLANPA